MGLLNPRNALKVAQNQYNNRPVPTTTPSTTPSVSSGGNGGVSSGGGSSGSTSASSGGSDLFNPNWTGGGNTGNSSSSNNPNNWSAEKQAALSRPVYRNGVDVNTSSSTYGQRQPVQPVQPVQPQMPEMQPQNQQNEWILKQNEWQNQQNEWMHQQNEANQKQQENWMKRQEEMQRNMQRMQAETPNFITDRATFEKMTGYDLKNEQERKVVDDYWNNASVNKNKNANDYYNDLKNGIALPNYEKNRPEYAQAEQTFARISKYKSMNSGQLANLFATGQLSSGDLALLHKENPSLAMDVAFTNSLNNAGKVDFEKDQLAMSNDIMKNWYTDLSNNERENLLANALSSDVNINNAMNDTKSKADKLGDLQKSVLNVSDEVDKELEGKNVPKSYADALKAKRSMQIHTAIASAQIDYANAMNYQKDLIENKKYDIDYQRQLENRKFQVGQSIFMGRENQRLDQENAMYNTQLGLQKAQWEFEQKIAQDKQIQNDPRLATQAMIDSYRKQGINAMRSDAEIIADIQNQVANGRSLGEALTDLNKAFQSKDEYKTLQRLHNGQMSEAEKLQAQQSFAMKQMAMENQYAINKMALANDYDIQNTMMKYDLSNKADQKKAIQELVLSGQMSSAEANATMRNINGNWNGAKGVELLFAEDGTWIKSQLPQTTNKSGGIECAEYISRMIGSRVGNTWEEKKKLNPEKTGKIGSIIVWQPSKTGGFAKYGHAGIIIGEEGNNWIVKNANYNVDGKISTIKVPKNTAGARYRSTNIMNTLGASSKAQTANTSSALQPYLDAINAGTMSINDAIKEFGTSKEGLAQKNELMRLYSQQGGKQFDPAKSGEYQELANQIEELKALRDDKMMGASVGPSGTGWFSRTSIAPWNWGDKDAYLARANKVLNNAVLNKLIEAKANGATFGALSDTELNMLKNSSNILNALAIKDEKGNIVGFNGTEVQFKKEVDKMIANTELVMKRMSTQGVQNTGGDNFLTNIVTSTGKKLVDYFN